MAWTEKQKAEEFERASMPEKYFGEAKLRFKRYYEDNLPKFRESEKAFRNLISLLISDSGVQVADISSRIKDQGECIRKFDGKYREYCEQTGEKYCIEDKITDLLGLRVVFYYESDIKRIGELLASHLEEIERTNKSEAIEKTVREFGYKGLHLDFYLDHARKQLPEYKKFNDLRFELQIRTIIQDAWSELDHKLKYKKEIPGSLQIKVHRLAALFELADQEFENIRSESERLEREALSSTKIDEQISLDTFGFLRVAQPCFESFRFSGDNLADIVLAIREHKSDITTAYFRGALESSLGKTLDYRDYLQGIGTPMAPYTVIRHALYLYDKRVFCDLIFSNHRKNFDRWLEFGTVYPSEVYDIKKQKRTKPNGGQSVEPN
jgi:ppGpp synthetase/RelA/SpoT-type nucleotidyltranferase